MINRNIESLDKANTKQLCRRPEHAVAQDAVEGKIGFELRFIDGKFRPAHLLGVIEPVPGRRAKSPPSLSITC
jgi:hypothetical protein